MLRLFLMLSLLSQLGEDARDESELGGKGFANVVFALFPPLDGRMKKADKRVAYSARAVKAFDAWAPSAPHEVTPMQSPAAVKEVA